MKISEVIKKLYSIQNDYGDLDVMIGFTIPQNEKIITDINEIFCLSANNKLERVVITNWMIDKSSITKVDKLPDSIEIPCRK